MTPIWVVRRQRVNAVNVYQWTRYYPDFWYGRRISFLRGTLAGLSPFNEGIYCRVGQTYKQQCINFNLSHVRCSPSLSNNLNFVTCLQNVGAVSETSGGEGRASYPKPSWTIFTSLIDFICFVVTLVTYTVLLLGYIPQPKSCALSHANLQN